MQETKTVWENSLEHGSLFVWLKQAKEFMKSAPTQSVRQVRGFPDPDWKRPALFDEVQAIIDAVEVYKAHVDAAYKPVDVLHG
jgi:hypothetical protein